MYTKISEANLTTIDHARPGDPAVVAFEYAGETVFALRDTLAPAGRFSEKALAAETVGAVYTDSNDELWFAVDPAWLKAHGETAVKNASDGVLAIWYGW